MTGVSLASVTKRFGNVSVIEELSLEVEPGEFLVLLGPSGCGKSTLLRMIAGLEELCGGSISIAGLRVDQRAPGDRGVAMVFQHYALYPHMTIHDNMAFGLRNMRVPNAEIAERIAVAARSLELEHLLDRKPGQLSGGQRQRVAIARAIVKQPLLFLFDEPLSNLDAALRIRTRLELAQLHQRLRTTMIFVTHDQVEAMTLADRIVVLREGKIEQIGSPMDIYMRPASQFVAAFVGSPAINLLPVVVSAGADGNAVAVLPGGVAVQTSIPATVEVIGDMTLGVRAEHVCVTSDAGLAAQVRLVERLGDRTLVHAELEGGTMLVAEAAGTSQLLPGETTMLTLSGSAVHLFAADGSAFNSPC